MKVAALGSGSRGNSVLVEAGSTRILVDAGFSGAQLARRLEALEVEPESVDALVVTHDHRDHTSGIGVAARRWGWPLYMSRRTARACRALLSGRERVEPIDRHAPLFLGDLEVHAFLTCHDAVDPLAVTVVDRARRLKVGIATDLGRATVPVRTALAGCHFLVLEANHDDLLLRDGPYPWPVKRRIGGSRGHLSNRLATELAAELAGPQLGGVMLAHLSEACNEPERARDAVGGGLEAAGWTGPLAVAGQDGPTRPFDIARAAEAARGPQLDLFRQDLSAGTDAPRGTGPPAAAAGAPGEARRGGVASTLATSRASRAAGTLEGARARARER